MSGHFVVTGASGFIGRRLCAALRPHGRVTAVVRRDRTGPWDDAVEVDLARDGLSPDALRGARAVFHLAGKAHAVAERRGDEAAYRLVNVEGTRRVVAAAAAAGVARLVFASSVKAMGEGGGSAGLETPYGRSKRDAETIVLDGGVAEPVVLRLPLVYGPGVEGNLGAMLRAVRAHRFPPPPRVENPRSMMHVDDVVRVMIAAARQPGVAGRVLVLGDGVAYTTHAIYASMRRALGREVPARALPAPVWRALARLGDVAGAVSGRRVPFDSDAHRKLFAAAWYPATDLGATLGVTGLRTLDDALADMISAQNKTAC